MALAFQCCVVVLGSALVATPLASFDEVNMDLLSEIINILTNDMQSLTNALLKTKVLAYKLNNDKLLKWVNNELNGYESGSVLPDYRIIPTTVVGSFSNGYQRANHAQIPTSHLDPKLQEALSETKMTHSVSNLEHLITYKDESLGQPLSPEICGFISRNFPYDGYVVEFAKKSLTKGQIVGILAQIRSKLLEFILELEKGKKDSEITSISNKDVDKILSTTIIGNNNVVLSGDNNTQNVSITVKKEDLKSFVKLLEKYNVEKEDINEITDVLKDEKPDYEKRDLGPKAKTWLTKMLSKAIQGTWDIAAGIAANLLTNALRSYYGF